MRAKILKIEFLVHFNLVPSKYHDRCIFCFRHFWRQSFNSVFAEIFAADCRKPVRFVVKKYATLCFLSKDDSQGFLAGTTNMVRNQFWPLNFNQFVFLDYPKSLQNAYQIKRNNYVWVVIKITLNKACLKDKNVN